MEKIRTQRKVVEQMNNGLRLFTSYPYSAGRFTCRVEGDNIFYNVTEEVLRSLIAKNIIGNSMPKTNREYEYFLIKPAGAKTQTTISPHPVNGKQ